MNKGIFIVVDGVDGSGKSTQAELINGYLIKQGFEVVLTKEPGGDNKGVCSSIRQILLNPEFKGNFSSRAELFLFLADRAQHVSQVIKPILDLGKIVVCDRYSASTFAYQVIARQVCSIDEFLYLNNLATSGLEPNLTFWFDLEPEMGLRRNASAIKKDRFEKENLVFHQKVREGFAIYFQEIHRGQFKKVDASSSLVKVHQQIIKTLESLLGGGD